MKGIYVLAAAAFATLAFGVVVAFRKATRPGANAYSARARLAILCNPRRT